MAMVGRPRDTEGVPTMGDGNCCTIGDLRVWMACIIEAKNSGDMEAGAGVPK